MATPVTIYDRESVAEFGSGSLIHPHANLPSTRPVSRAARMLALAHYVERLVEQGTVASYADAARQLGVSRARMSQILNLLNLPPRLQEGLLLGDLHLSERGIRALAGRGGVVERQGT